LNNKPKVDFRSGVTYWRALNGPGPEAPQLAGDVECEVAVIGSGISGALTALYLVRAGLDTLLIDQGELAAMSTAASTGLLMYETDYSLVELSSLVGEQHAVHVYRRGLAAIQKLEELADQLPDRCGFAHRPCLRFASRRGHVKSLRREFECRRHYGFDVQFLDRSELRRRSSLDAAAAIWSQGDAQLDPYRFTCQVLKTARMKGVRCYANTRVCKVLCTSAHAKLTTTYGMVAARHVVIATGYGVEDFLGRGIGKVRSTYVITSQPMASIPGWPESALIWETARPYLYARQTADQRIMAGGEDTAFHNDHRRDRLVQRKVVRLAARLQTLFPGIEIQPEFAWAGTFGETKDGMAYIGRPPGRDCEYFAIGFGGNGITFSEIAAQTITDLIVGRPNHDAEVFRFNR
jgi:glycine/D-amino acid oxidase-like deaminating enzyme